MEVILHGVLVDESTLGIDELARACGVDVGWVMAHVDAGLLGEGQPPRFRSAELRRARELVRIERTFEADQELAALVVDLLEEVRRLRARGL